MRFAALIFFLLPLCLCAQWRTFMSVQGEKLDGELLRVEGGTAHVALSAGRAIAVPMNDFSEEDRRFVEQWVMQNTAKQNGVLAAAFEEVEEAEEGLEIGPSQTAQKPEPVVNKFSVRGATNTAPANVVSMHAVSVKSQRQPRNFYHRITLSNSGPVDLTDMVVYCYTQFNYSSPRDPVFLGRYSPMVKREIPLLKAGEKISFEVERASFRVLPTDDSRVRSAKASDRRMLIVWIRVYHKDTDTLVFESRSGAPAEHMASRKEWPEYFVPDSKRPVRKHDAQEPPRTRQQGKK